MLLEDFSSSKFVICCFLVVGMLFHVFEWNSKLFLRSAPFEHGKFPFGQQHWLPKLAIIPVLWNERVNHWSESCQEECACVNLWTLGMRLIASVCVYVYICVCVCQSCFAALIGSVLKLRGVYHRAIWRAYCQTALNLHLVLALCTVS